MATGDPLPPPTPEELPNSASFIQGGDRGFVRDELFMLPGVDPVDEELVELAEAQLVAMDKRTAVVRSTVPVFWLSLIATGLSEVFGWDVTVDQLLPWSPAIAIGFGVAYRALRYVEDRFPVFGRIVFGSDSTPQY